MLFTHTHTHLLDVFQGEEAPALASRTDDLGVGVLALGEVLVVAALTGWAHLRVALVQEHAVQALRLEVARPLVRRLAVTLGDLGHVCRVHLHPPVRLVDLRNGREGPRLSPCMFAFLQGECFASVRVNTRLMSRVFPSYYGSKSTHSRHTLATHVLPHKEQRGRKLE